MSDTSGILRKRLARLSICQCGFPALIPDIELGRIYKIPRYNAVGVSDTWICGGCGNEMEVHCIMIINSHGQIEWLPMELFDWDETPETAQEDIKETGQGIATAKSPGLS